MHLLLYHEQHHIKIEEVEEEDFCRFICFKKMMMMMMKLEKELTEIYLNNMSSRLNN